MPAASERREGVLCVSSPGRSAAPGVGADELEEPAGYLAQLGVVAGPDLPDGTAVQALVGQDHVPRHLDAVPAGRGSTVLEPADTQPDGPHAVVALTVLDDEVRAALPLPHLLVRPLRRLGRPRVVVHDQLVVPLRTQ